MWNRDGEIETKTLVRPEIKEWSCFSSGAVRGDRTWSGNQSTFSKEGFMLNGTRHHQAIGGARKPELVTLSSSVTVADGSRILQDHVPTHTLPAERAMLPEASGSEPGATPPAHLARDQVPASTEAGERALPAAPAPAAMASGLGRDGTPSPPRAAGSGSSRKNGSKKRKKAKNAARARGACGGEGDGAAHLGTVRRTVASADDGDRTAPCVCVVR